MQALNDFIFDTSKYATDDDVSIKLNHRKGPAQCYNSYKFNNIYISYIKSKLTEKPPLTDLSNSIGILGCLNYIYIDGDWKFKTSTETSNYALLCESLARHITKLFITSLTSIQPTDYYYFIFTPIKYTDRKGGFHTFIITESNISVETRNEIYSNTVKLLQDQTSKEYQDTLYLLDYITLSSKVDETPTDLSKVIDPSPLNPTMSCLLPFAQKSSQSRQYKLANYNDFAKGSKSGFLTKLDQFFTYPSSHTKSDVIEEVVSSVGPSTINESIDPDILRRMTQIDSIANDIKFDRYRNKCTALLFDYIDSLIYLSNNHNLWNIMSDHDARLYQVMVPIINTTYMFMFLDNKGKIPCKHEYMAELIYRHYIKLVRHAFLLGKIDKNSNEMKKMEESTRVHVYFFVLKTDSRGARRYTSQLSEAWNHIVNHERNKKGNKTKSKSTKNDADSTDSNEYSDEIYTNEKKEIIDEEKLINNIREHFKRVMNRWGKFNQKIIRDGLTNEIQPFDEIETDTGADIRLGKTFSQYIPVHLNTINKITISKKKTNNHTKTDQLRQSKYDKVIRSWVLMFLFTEYYETHALPETIRSIISGFMRYYIWNIRTEGKSYIYIYNIHQTNELSALPYNQWVKDIADGDSLKSWIKSFYMRFISTELRTSNKNLRINALFDILSYAQFKLLPPYAQSLKPLNNFDADMNRVFNNIVSGYEHERYAPPQELNPTTSNFFPMRNGIMEFHNDGTYTFHRDNHTRFMEGYTNVVWDDNYNRNCVEFAKVNDMINKIYPIKAEKDYALKLYSSVLFGNGLRDLFIILYGSGGDGKTTISNAIQAMLGGEGISQGVVIHENNMDVRVINPCGLSASMKTETILTSNRNSHDEGGCIQLKNKRFCSVQEPDPQLSNSKLNMANIKELLSGTSIVGRHIYAQAESFVPNCLLTLQTNVMLGYSEDNDAVRRRICVINHRSKFTTDITKDRMNTLEYKFAADPTLNFNLSNNWKYWQALFYTLLPYACDILRKNELPLSNIPRPNSIVSTTNNSFVSSNGLVGWLNMHFIEKEGVMMSIKKATSNIIGVNKNLKRNQEPLLLNAKKDQGYVNEVYNQLLSTYLGKIYRLRDEFLDPKKRKVRDNVDVDEEANSNEELIEKYMYRYAVENMERSVNDKSNLFLIGYEYIENDE